MDASTNSEKALDVRGSGVPFLGHARLAVDDGGQLHAKRQRKHKLSNSCGKAAISTHDVP